MEKIMKNMISQKKFRACLKSPEAIQTFQNFAEKTSAITIWRSAGWQDFRNQYRIFEIEIDGEKYYLRLIVEEYNCMGTEWAECISASDKEGYIIEIEPVEWVTKEVTLNHWEDGTMMFIVADICDNKTKYLLGSLPAPEGFGKWREQEYQDFDNIEYLENMFAKTN